MLNRNQTIKPLYSFVGLLIGLALVVSACTSEPQVETEAGDEIVQAESDIQGEDVVVEAVQPVTGTNSAGVLNADGAMVRATHLLDYDFTNINGDVAGEIENVLLDISTGQILFVTVEYGGFLDLGDTHLAMPLNAFSWDTDNTLVLNIEEERLENFPDLEDNWPDLTTNIWDDEINEFWMDEGIHSGVELDDDTSQVMYMDDFLDVDIADIGFGNGDIYDVLIDLSQSQGRYVVADYGDEMFDNNLLAVPFAAFFGRVVDNEIIFDENLDLETLQVTPVLERVGFDEANLFERGFDSNIVDYWNGVGYTVETEEGL